MSAQPQALASFQRHRSQAIREAILAAVRELDRGGQQVNVSAVARKAGVDRSYIYEHPDLLEQIRALGSSRSEHRPTRPATEQASLESLRARLEAAHAELTRLRAENDQLRRTVERGLGERWEGALDKRQ
ncbi:MAG: DUF6262 family protein [Thermoleophilaceae bacterium]